MYILYKKLNNIIPYHYHYYIYIPIFICVNLSDSRKYPDKWNMKNVNNVKFVDNNHKI